MSPETSRWNSLLGRRIQETRVFWSWVEGRDIGRVHYPQDVKLTFDGGSSSRQLRPSAARRQRWDPACRFRPGGRDEGDGTLVLGHGRAAGLPYRRGLASGSRADDGSFPCEGSLDTTRDPVAGAHSGAID